MVPFFITARERHSAAEGWLKHQVESVIVLPAESSGALLSTGAFVVRWLFATQTSNSPKSLPLPPLPGVFLVSWLECTDRGHSSGLDPLEKGSLLLGMALESSPGFLVISVLHNLFSIFTP